VSKGRAHITLDELVRAARPQVTAWKKDDPRRYEGLEECRKNVIKCNCAYKLKYCKPSTLN